MKIKLILLITILISSLIIEARTVRVKSSIRKNGKFVQSHYKTSADRRKANNWSYKGNVNPMTSKKGYKNN